MTAPAPEMPPDEMRLAPPMRWRPYGITRAEPMDAEAETLERVRRDLLTIHDRLADFRPGTR